jgi:hypothetical protein
MPKNVQFSPMKNINKGNVLKIEDNITF